MSERMTIECACERGGNCTSISACSADSILEDQADSYEDRIAELEAENKIRKLVVQEQQATIERLEDPDWNTYIEITTAWLEKYPPDIFTGESGDAGPVFVVAVRDALAALADKPGDESE